MSKRQKEELEDIRYFEEKYRNHPTTNTLKQLTLLKLCYEIVWGG